MIDLRHNMKSCETVVDANPSLHSLSNLIRNNQYPECGCFKLSVIDFVFLRPFCAEQVVF